MNFIFLLRLALSLLSSDLTWDIIPYLPTSVKSILNEIIHKMEKWLIRISNKLHCFDSTCDSGKLYNSI